ncbi:MAG: YkgJ family cysteine cluster protein [Bacteroidia bacterium]|nr:YkgJ family cysteine cluster protein [Bacteroidia bacterium]
MIPPNPETEIAVLLQMAKDKRKKTQDFLRRLRRQNPHNLDSLVHPLHDEVFADTDCLKCANCCKTTSPRFTDKDIARIARHLRMKPSLFVEEYLHLDEENDYVLNAVPCPFLGYDNYCSIYEERPKACREYPHTNQKKIHQILRLTEKNAEICPATFRIVEKLREIMEN